MESLNLKVSEEDRKSIQLLLLIKILAELKATAALYIKRSAIDKTEASLLLERHEKLVTDTTNGIFEDLYSSFTQVDINKIIEGFKSD